MTDSNADALELTLDEREMEDLEVQSEAEEVPVAISPTGATRDILPQRPAVQSLEEPLPHTDTSTIIRVVIRVRGGEKEGDCEDREG